MEIVGKNVGRYSVTEWIGAGGMAEVFKAYDPDIDRTVALKILKQEHCVDDEHVNRFMREGRAAGALTHPNIVTIHDVGKVDDAPYIMMELLAGQPLNELLREQARISAVDTLRIAIQISDALDYAHSKGVIHRDVKPDNIIVDDNLAIKIADFGIARLEEASKDTTQAGMILGTPRYMSPEQAAGEVVDGRSDLFSLGVILYEMLTGHKAFDAESMATLIMQIMQKDPPPIRKVATDIPAGLQNIVSKLLAKKPNRRFQSGAELRQALQRELSLLEEDEQERARYMPLQIKWTAIMAAVVAVAMGVSSLFVLRAQNHALEQQAIDAGISLAKFIAVQTAVPVLGEDWITLETFVEDASARETFDYLVVTDHESIIRSATNAALVGTSREDWAQRLAADTAANVLRKDGEVVVHGVVNDATEVFNFSLPILFRTTQVGSIDVGVSRTGLEDAMTTTTNLLVLLGLAMVTAVGVVVFVFNQLVAKNLSLATKALMLLSQGKLEARISKQRTDEFGDLFLQVNNFADQVQRQVEHDGLNLTAPEVSGANDVLDISGIEQVKVDDQTIVQPAKPTDAQ